MRAALLSIHHSSFRIHHFFSTATSGSVAAYQSFTYQSKLPEASVRPSGEKATEVTAPSWPSSFTNSWNETALQRRTVLSVLPVAMVGPSGEKVIDLIALSWPESASIHLRRVRS